jgi:SpoVK/Ycf46/Vps4 family AAA+-type ATPase
MSGWLSDWKIEVPVKESRRDNRDIALEVLKIIVSVGLTYCTLRLGYAMLDHMSSAGKATKMSAEVTKKALAKRLQRPEVSDMDFDQHELSLLSDILGPDEIKETFADIGGMEEQLEEVADNIVLPMQLWSRFRKVGVFQTGEEELAVCPTGMLLYGQPGTGKTLTAKAVAKGVYGRLIVVYIFSLTNLERVNRIWSHIY